MTEWIVPYERTCRGTATVEADTAQDAEKLIDDGDFDPDWGGEEIIDWDRRGYAREQK